MRTRATYDALDSTMLLIGLVFWTAYRVELKFLLLSKVCWRILAAFLLGNISLSLLEMFLADLGVADRVL